MDIYEVADKYYVPHYPEPKLFKPVHPEKYVGDPNNIVCRSRLERKCMEEFDIQEHIVRWTSENLVVRYISPVDGQQHRYFVDFLVTARQPDGTNQVYAVEIKPESQTKPPRKRKRKSKLFLEEAKTYAVNVAKWKAAHAWCAKHNWKFVIWTEKNLGIKYYK